MDKKKKIRIDSQTQSEEYYFVSSDEKATAATENIFTKDGSFIAFDEVIFTVKDRLHAKEKSTPSD